MKSVLYISYDGLTDPLGQSQVLPYLKELSRQGFQFTILSFEKKERFSKEKDLVNSSISSTGIEWLPLSFTSKPPVLSKIYDRWRLRRTVSKLCRRRKFDLVHCRSYVAAEAGLQVRRKPGVKFLFDMRGFWADERVENGQWNQMYWVYRTAYRHYKRKEKDFLLAADGIVTLTQAARNFLLQQPAYKNLLIEVIPCCADFDHFDYHKIPPAGLATLRRQLGIPESAKVVTYSGSVGGWYMTKEMFLFFAQLARQRAEYELLILTRENADSVKQQAIACGVPGNKIHVTYATRDLLPQFLALSSVGLFFIRNTFSKMASSPTKHGEFMGMGIPVVCNAIGDLEEIITKTRTGLITNEFTESCFQQVIDKIDELERQDKEYIRVNGKKIYDLQSGAKKYLRLYEQILSD